MVTIAIDGLQLPRVFMVWHVNVFACVIQLQHMACSNIHIVCNDIHRLITRFIAHY